MFWGRLKRQAVIDDKKGMGYLPVGNKTALALAALVVATASATAAGARPRLIGHTTSHVKQERALSVDDRRGLRATLTLHATVSGKLYPGSTVKLRIDYASSREQSLGTIHLAGITACDRAFISDGCPSGHELRTCESIDDGAKPNAHTASFYMADVAANPRFGHVGHSDGQRVTTTGVLRMNDLAASQDSCKRAALLLDLTTF